VLPLTTVAPLQGGFPGLLQGTHHLPHFR
jgi:hypothetical protein